MDTSQQVQITLISPDFTDIKNDEGDSVKEAIASFKSSVWRQGWGADERVMREYGDWLVYQRESNSLTYLGVMSEIS